MLDKSIDAAGGVISVQVLNEFVSVASRKLTMRLLEIREALSAVRAACSVEPLSTATHDVALDLMEGFHLAFYDALIVAAAALAKCSILYSEDMQDAQKIAGVTIRNPFADR
jgi:predicted nucleic acid-binding protein